MPQTASMTSADWGVDLPELHVPGTRPRWDPVDSDEPGDLPVVAAARALGWEPAHEAPLWCFLPAVWEHGSRAWVQDRRIRHARVVCDAGPPRTVPWSTWDYADLEADTNALLAGCGLPPRPFGRLWLLRPPPGFGSMDEVLDHLSDHAVASGEEIVVTPGFVRVVADEVHRLFSAR